MRRKAFTVTPQVDADGLAASQSPAGAGNLTLDGALIVAGAWASAGTWGQLVSIVSAADDSGRTFTVTGSVNGVAQTEAITGANAGTATGAKYFDAISSIAVDAATAGAVTAGFAGGAATPPFIVNYKMKNFKAGLQINVTGTIDYTVQNTLDDLFATDATANTVTWLSHDDTNLVAATTDKTGNYAYPPVATRCKVNSVTSPGSLVYTVIVPA